MHFLPFCVFILTCVCRTQDCMYVRFFVKRFKRVSVLSVKLCRPILCESKRKDTAFQLKKSRCETTHLYDKATSCDNQSKFHTLSEKPLEKKKAFIQVLCILQIMIYIFMCHLVTYLRIFSGLITDVLIIFLWL